MKQYKTRKLMILFAILILVMVPFSSVMAQDAGLPAGEVALQAELQNAGHVSIKSNAPPSVSVVAGDLNKLDLRRVFQVTPGYTLTYSFSGDNLNDHVKIGMDGTVPTFFFTVPDPGTYQVTLTATCSDGDSASHVVTYTVSTAAPGEGFQYNYRETDVSAGNPAPATPGDNTYPGENKANETVDVYVTISNDGMPIQGNDTQGTKIAGLEVTVPYFDLASYGLQNYYRYHTANGQGSYNDNVVVRRPTMLHLYIYMLERYYMGLPEDQCGQGSASGVLNYSTNTQVNYIDTFESGTLAYSSGTRKAIEISGSATSCFLNNFWGHDLNLMYYRNGAYPLMSPGWGATCDYILLSGHDRVDVGLFTDWGFYNNGGFLTMETTPGASNYAFAVKKFGTDAMMGASSGFQPVTESLKFRVYDSSWNLVVSEMDAVPPYQYGFTAPGTYHVLGLDPARGTSGAKYAPAVDTVKITAAA